MDPVQYNQFPKYTVYLPTPRNFLGYYTIKYLKIEWEAN